MAYRFVAAKYFTAGGMAQPRAVVIHMAEGGGTVEWLSGGVTNNNSSHFVVRYSGEIVQMVREGDASHSLFNDPRSDAPGPGDFGIFGAGAAKGVLGDGWSNPNRYLFAVEVEGYAAIGPNAAQTTALAQLVADLRARHPSLRGNLGHRDFQDYKPCPGGLIPWASLGGHGLYQATPPPPPPVGALMPAILNPKAAAGTFTTGPGAVSFRVRDGADGAVGPNEPQQVVMSGTLDGLAADAWFTAGAELYAFRKTAGTFVAAATGVPGALDETAIRKDQRAKDRAEAGAKLLPDI